MHNLYPVRYGNRHNTINPLWNALFSPALDSHTVRKKETSSWMPAVDIRELDDQFKLTIDIPGMSAADVDVTVEKNVLSLSGKRSENEAGVDKGYTMTERKTGEFTRRFTLPDDIDADGITATAENGVLSISIPRNKESTVRKIAVNG